MDATKQSLRLSLRLRFIPILSFHKKPDQCCWRHTLTAMMTLRELKRKYVLCFTALTCTYRCKFLLVVFLCHLTFFLKSFFAKYILPFYEEIQLALDKRLASTQVILLWPRRTKGLKAVPIWSFFGCILTSL